MSRADCVELVKLTAVCAGVPIVLVMLTHIILRLSGAA